MISIPAASRSKFCKLFRDNLEIMYKHLRQEKTLLQEKLGESKHILKGINKEIDAIEGREEQEETGKQE